MPSSSSAVQPVHVPPRYPTSLIYTDESTAAATAGKFFVVGAVKVRRPGQLMRGIQEIRDRHDFADEFKFTKISRGKFPVFCELINLLEQSDAHIGACVVDSRRGSNPFKAGEASWLVHARITAKLLVGIINRRELASVLMDQVATPKGCAFDDTVRDMTNQRLRCTSLVTAACLDSTSTDGIQVADLVAGAVAHQRQQAAGGASSTSHKAKIAGRLAASFGVPDFGSDVKTERVNISTHGTRARLRSVEGSPALAG
jgi:hypothetical protein